MTSPLPDVLHRQSKGAAGIRFQDESALAEICEGFVVSNVGYAHKVDYPPARSIGKRFGVPGN